MNTNEALAQLIAHNPDNTYSVHEEAWYNVYGYGEPSQRMEYCITWFLGLTIENCKQAQGPDLPALLAEALAIIPSAKVDTGIVA